MLIIDDDEGVCRTFADYLADEFRCSVLFETSVEAAKRIIVGNRPHVLLVDYNIGGFGANGNDLLRWIAETMPDYHPAVVICSGALDVEAVLSFSSLGYWIILQKPVVLSDLVAAVKTAIGERNKAVLGELAVDELRRISASSLASLDLLESLAKDGEASTENADNLGKLRLIKGGKRGND